MAAQASAESRTLLKERLDEQETDDVLKDIYDTTTNAETGEVARGWATGPFTEKQMDELQNLVTFNEERILKQRDDSSEGGVMIGVW